MTREEAINVFRNIVPIENNEEYAKNITEAIDMAIEALSEPKWECTANFIAEQLDRLKNMTDEERLKLLQIIFPSTEAQTQAEKCEECIHHDTHKDKITCKECVSIEVEPSLKTIKRQIDEHWYLDKSDFISRQWLLDLYATPKGREDVNWKVPLEVVQQNIKDAPSADAEWIPCSERLPKEERKTYWVCTDTEYQCECRWTNNRFGIGEGDWGWSIFDTPQYSKPIAWMPLPELYREDGEE